MKYIFTGIKKKIAVATVLCMIFTLSMPIGSMAATVSDVSGHWASSTIQSWVDDGLIAGYPDGTFRPDRSISRAEFMTLVNRSYGYTATAAISFSDVKADAWYYNAVAIAKAAGYISGYPDGSMKPDYPISREEAATIIMNINRLQANEEAASKYTDVTHMVWSRGAVGAVSLANLMNGYPDGSFGPQAAIKRGETVVTLDRSNNYVARPDAPALARNDETNTVSGMATTMEYELDGATWENYAVSTFDDIDFSGKHTLIVRYASTASTPYSQTTTLDFTTNSSTGGGGGGGGGGDNDTAVSAITVTSSAVSISTDNGTLTMSAIVAPTDASDKAVTWSVVPGTGTASISANGILTALTDGTVTVKATSVSTGSVSGSLQITLSNQVLTAVTSPVFTTAVGNTRVTITLVDGTFKAGPIAASDFTFAGTDNAVLAAATTFTRISDTVVTITGLGALAGGADNTVLVKAATQATEASAVSAVASTIIDVTSPVFTTVVGDNTATITLTGGTFKAGAIAASDFTFAGADNAALAAATTFTRTSDTAVTITGFTALGGVNNTVLVKAATQATAASAVTAVASTITDVTSLPFTTAAGNNKVTITLTGGTFKAGPIVVTDFTFGGTNNAALAAASIYSITSDTVVMITGVGLVGAADNTVLVKAATQATQASAVAGTASTVIADVTSPVFTTVVGDNSATITLTGGTFKAGAIAASDFTFTGADNAILAAATTFTRTSDTVVTITGFTALGGVDNTVLVKEATQATPASAVAGTASTVIADVTSPVFTTVVGDDTATITLTGGTFKAGAIAASDFTFAGADNAILAAATTFTRTSDTVVTITGFTALGGVNNTVLVKAATQATQASAVLGAASTI